MITQDSYRKLNEISSGDVRIMKAVILLLGYLPRNRIDLCKDFSHDVHALYNTYAWNIRTNSLSSGEILSHSEIAYRNHVDPKKIIGYLVKEGNQPVDCDLLPDAYSSLQKRDVDLLIKELKMKNGDRKKERKDVYVMIIINESRNLINEKVTGELATALKTDILNKKDLIYYLKKHNIDFDRTINSAVKISPKDSRLNDSSNIIIGVFRIHEGVHDSYLSMDVWANGRHIADAGRRQKPSSKAGVISNSGDIEYVNFSKISWSKWVKLAASIYIIEDNDKVKLSDIRSNRGDKPSWYDRKQTPFNKSSAFRVLELLKKTYNRVNFADKKVVALLDNSSSAEYITPGKLSQSIVDNSYAVCGIYKVVHRGNRREGKTNFTYSIGSFGNNLYSEVTELGYVDGNSKIESTIDDWNKRMLGIFVLESDPN